MNDKSNLIALLTDFGTRDYFVGAMKGVILSANPNALAVDITHEIESQNVAAASFTLRACYKNFPEKTIFVAVVDPGVGSRRKAILVETESYFFIAPDNGLLSFVFNDEQKHKVYELTNEKFFAANVSRTFHGRDVFAPVAAHLSNGVSPSEFGSQTNDYIRLDETKPSKTGSGNIIGSVIHIDKFGNLISNLTKENLHSEKFVLEIGGAKIENLKNYFAEVAKSEIMMIFGSADFLEIVAFQDSAQRLLNVEVGCEIVVTNS